MEKINENDDEDYREPCPICHTTDCSHWRLTDCHNKLDAYRQAVKALVEAAKRVQVDYDTLCVYVYDQLVRWRTYQVTVNAVIQAIAAVERLGG